MIGNLKKNSKETHSNGSWNENKPYLCLFCNSKFREKAIWEDIEIILSIQIDFGVSFVVSNFVFQKLLFY